MSVKAICDRCESESDFMDETYAQGRYVYRLPNKWKRAQEVKGAEEADKDMEWAHLCPGCAAAVELHQAGKDLVKTVSEVKKVCEACGETWIVLHNCQGAP